MAASSSAPTAGTVPSAPAFSRRIFLTFNGVQVEKPVVYEIGHRYKVITNIRGASITDNFGIMALELSGPEKEVTDAIAWIESLGIKTWMIDADE
ncbi:MAG TPA: NIL domain-containing protein [Planctomycetota bacterium]|nr:NIL domain-containing protein [Planctomycetota bacterium]